MDKKIKIPKKDFGEVDLNKIMDIGKVDVFPDGVEVTFIVKE